MSPPIPAAHYTKQDFARRMVNYRVMLYERTDPMKKIDLKKELPYYSASKDKPALIDIPPMNYLMVDGCGNPATAQEYKDSIEALYPVAYTLKFMVKKGPMALDYGVMPLEGLWWVEDMREFSVDRKDDWLWTSTIMQPDFITREMFAP